MRPSQWEELGHRLTPTQASALWVGTWLCPRPLFPAAVTPKPDQEGSGDGQGEAPSVLGNPAYGVSVPFSRHFDMGDLSPPARHWLLDASPVVRK